MAAAIRPVKESDDFALSMNNQTIYRNSAAWSANTQLRARQGPV
jgi:hypothetical protein